MIRFLAAATLALLAAAPASAAPPPSAMPNDAIAKAWPGQHPTYGMGRFSPDGSQLAFVAGQLVGANDQAWLYDLKTKKLVAVSEAPKKTGSIEIPHMSWGADGVLYVDEARDLQDGYGVKHILLAFKGGKASTITAFPKDVADLFDADDRADAAFEDKFIRNYDNGRVTVTLQNTYHGDYRLSMKRKGAKKPTVIANGGGELVGFLFDKQHSLVRYTDDINKAIVTYDLNAAKALTLLTYGQAEVNLLDQTSDGTLLAYERFGSCDASVQGKADSIYYVCFVRLAP